MKLIWKNSGDFIQIEPINLEVSQYYFTNWKKHNSDIFINEKPFKVDKILNELKFCLNKINNVLDFFKIKDLNLSLSLNQDDLNLLHEHWVLLNRKYPSLGNLLEKKEKGSKKYLDDINELIHELESCFNFILSNNSTKFLPNLFSSTITSFDISNVFLVYKNLGRQSYDKFIHFDKSTQNIDRNDFTELSGYIGINLEKPRSVKISPEYVEWCADNNISYPSGDRINLGNFLNLEKNLTLYRELFYKNFCLENNEVIFEL